MVDEIMRRRYVGKQDDALKLGERLQDVEVLRIVGTGWISE
jgi:hypothetical protein